MAADAKRFASLACGLSAEQRWMRVGCFERIVGDVQSLLRQLGGRKGQPTAVCLDSRTLQSTPESGARAGYDGAKRRKGFKVHIVVDTRGHPLALTVTPANQGDGSQVEALARQMQQVTGDTVEMAYVDQATPARLRSVATSLARRTKLRLGRTLPQTRQRL